MNNKMNEKIYTICIDPGHGGKKVGAIYNGLHEADVVLGISLFLYSILKDSEYNIKPVMTRFIDEDISLRDRTLIANSINADLFISVHINADPDDDSEGQPEAKGEEIWIYKNSKGGRKVASAMAESVDSIFTEHKFRGIKESDKLYVLKHTQMPAVLLELGFIDCKKENNYLKNKMEQFKIAGKIAEGIFNYLKINIRKEI